MNEKTVAEILHDLEAAGSLDWMEAAGLCPLTWRHWLRWYELYNELNTGRGSHATDKVVAIMTAYYAQNGGAQLTTRFSNMRCAN